MWHSFHVYAESTGTLMTCNAMLKRVTQKQWIEAEHPVETQSPNKMTLDLDHVETKRGKKM